MKQKKLYKAVICLSIAIFLSLSIHAVAATLMITSGTIILDTQGAAVNAVEAHLTFDPKMFSVKDTDDGGSIVNFWVKHPAFSNVSGTLDFSGIIPGGVTTHQGLLLRFSLAPKMTNTTSGFSVIAARALLNDGKGTPAPLSIVSQPFAFALNTTPETTPSSNNQPPNPFAPQIAQNADVFGGKYFLAFAATDENYGIDHYEVREGVDPWQRATSPYLLQNQTLSSDIYVRAVDKAGNARVEVIHAIHLPTQVLRDIIVGLAILCLGTLWLMRRRKQQ